MPKILYVEDEPFLAKIVKESLESRKFEVHLVDHGAEATAAYEEQKPDLCILDVMLPGKNGFEIAKDIRQRNSSIPILFLTAKDQTEDLVHGFNAGGNDYIKKPFSMEELIIRINNLLSLTGGRQHGQLVGDSIAIGSQYIYLPKKMLLQHGEESQALSHKESEILKLLCQYQNDTLERKTLLMQVWQDDSYFNSRNLDVYIRKLRRYLDKDDGVRIITLKGIGYRFQVE